MTVVAKFINEQQLARECEIGSRDRSTHCVRRQRLHTSAIAELLRGFGYSACLPEQDVGDIARWDGLIRPEVRRRPLLITNKCSSGGQQNQYAEMLPRALCTTEDDSGESLLKTYDVCYGCDGLSQGDMDIVRARLVRGLNNSTRAVYQKLGAHFFFASVELGTVEELT